MAPDLPETLLGTDADGTDRRDEESAAADDDEPRTRFVFVGLGEHTLAIPIANVQTIAEPPDSLTRVPRSPPAIEGVMDLRGDVTVVIDPRAHFPTTETRDGDERLLVFDRPTDQQSAAIRVDNVIGVETILERHVLDEAAIEERELSGRALDHPLVTALVEQERSPETESSAVVETAADEGRENESAISVGSGSGATLSSTQQSSADGLGSIGETFELDAEEDVESQPAVDESPQELVVEVTAVVDVEKLLLASGHGT